MSAASKKKVRKLAPIIALLVLGGLFGVARASITGSEFNVAVGSNFLDPNNYILFQTSVGAVVNQVETGTTMQFTLGATNNTSAATKFYFTGSITQNGAAVTSPTVQFACSSPTGYTCPVNGLAAAYDFPYLNATGAQPGTYQISFTAVDVTTSAVSYSPTYSFVVSSPAAGLAKNQFSASTLMTLNLNGSQQQTIYAALPSAGLPIGTTDSTAGTATTAGGFVRPITLILNNVGTSTIVVTDGNNTVTLGAGDVIAAAFVASVKASVIEGIPGVLRVGIP
jgi:hypothetical protein